MTMSRSFDLLVIGAGMAGQTVAEKCASEGWKGAIAGELPYGGTSALRGCDPKKVLVAAAEAWDWQQRMRGHGFRCDEAGVHLAQPVRSHAPLPHPLPA